MRSRSTPRLSPRVVRIGAALWGGLIFAFIVVLALANRAGGNDDEFAGLVVVVAMVAMVVLGVNLGGRGGRPSKFRPLRPDEAVQYHAGKQPDPGAAPAAPAAPDSSADASAAADAQDT